MARRLGILLLVVLAMAATAAPSQGTTSTTSTTSTTMPAPTTTTSPPTRPPLPSCREVLASDPKGSVFGDDPTRIRVVGLPRARRLTVDLHYTGGAGGVDVRNCVSLLSSAGEEVATQDSPSLCCVSFDHRFSVLLPHQPAPGTRVCAQEAVREAFSDGLDVGFSVVFTNRVCLVMPVASPGELPFTGPVHAVPLAVAAVLAIALGVAVLLAASKPQQRS